MWATSRDANEKYSVIFMLSPYNPMFYQAALNLYKVLFDIYFDDNMLTFLMEFLYHK